MLRLEELPDLSCAAVERLNILDAARLWTSWPYGDLLRANLAVSGRWMGRMPSSEHGGLVMFCPKGWPSPSWFVSARFHCCDWLFATPFPSGFL